MPKSTRRQAGRRKRGGGGERGGRLDKLGRADAGGGRPALAGSGRRGRVGKHGRRLGHAGGGSAEARRAKAGWHEQRQGVGHSAEPNGLATGAGRTRRMARRAEAGWRGRRRAGSGWLWGARERLGERSERLGHAGGGSAEARRARAGWHGQRRGVGPLGRTEWIGDRGGAGRLWLALGGEGGERQDLEGRREPDEQTRRNPRSVAGRVLVPRRELGQAPRTCLAGTRERTSPVAAAHRAVPGRKTRSEGTKSWSATRRDRGARAPWVLCPETEPGDNWAYPGRGPCGGRGGRPRTGSGTARAAKPICAT